MGQSQVGRRRVQRAARKMLEGQRVVLEGRVQVGLGQVPRVAGLGEQREVGQAEVAHEPGARRQARRRAVRAQPGVGERKERGQGQGAEEPEEAVGLAHRVAAGQSRSAWERAFLLRESKATLTHDKAA